jgi:hypothetical protein
MKENRRGSVIVDYLMVIGVVVAVAIPIIRYYFGDQLSRTFFRNREKLVSMVAQERQQTIPNQWFDQESGGPNRPPGPPTGAGPGAGPNSGPDGGPDASPGANSPGPTTSSPGIGPSPSNDPNYPSLGATPLGKPSSPVGAGTNNSTTGATVTTTSTDFFDSARNPSNPTKPVDSKTEPQENFFRKVGGDNQPVEPNSVAAAIKAEKARGKSADDPKIGADSIRDRQASGQGPGGGGGGGKGRWSWWFLLRILLLLLLILLILYVAFTSLRRR